MTAFALLLAACAADPAVDTAAESDWTPVPYVFEEDAPPEAGLQADELEGVLSEAIDLALALNAAPIFPAYRAAMSGAEEGCPAYYDYEGSQYWYDQCTASSGTDYAGYSFYQLYDDYDFGDGTLYDGESVYGVAKIVTAEGYTFQSGGSAYVASSEGEGYTSFASVIAGSFAWDGPEAEGTWLAEGVSPDVGISAYVTDYGNIVQVDGGLSGLGSPLDTVVFDGMLLYEAALGSTCPTEPGGSVSIRDDEGYWYDILFDGPPGWGETSDPALCDGCGAAYFRGELLGEVCADFSALLAFEDAPW